MALFTVNGIVRVGTDPELRFAPSGIAVCKFRAATSKAKKLDDGSWETTAELWVTVTAFGQLAEHIAEHVEKGKQAYVAGSIYEDTWTTSEGEERKQIKVLADAVQPLEDRRNNGGGNRSSGGQQQSSAPRQDHGDPWGPADSDPPF